MGLFDFLKDANSETKAVKGAAKTVFNFLKTDEKPKAPPQKKMTVRQSLDAQAKANPQDQTLQQAAASKPNTFNPAKTVVEAIAPIPETAIRSGTELAYNRVVAPAFNLPQQSLSTQAPTDPLRKAFYGNNPVSTYQKQGEDIQKATGGKVPAVVAAPVLAALDLTPGGKGIKPLERSIAEATTAKAVKTLLKDQPKEIVDQIAPQLAHATDSNAVKNILDKHLPNRNLKINNPDNARTGLEINNPDGARTTGLDINNPLGAQTKPLDINNPLGAETGVPLKVKNNTGAPLVGEQPLSGAAQQSFLGKLKPKPLNEVGGGPIENSPIRKSLQGEGTAPVNPAAQVPERSLVDSSANGTPTNIVDATVPKVPAKVGEVLPGQSKDPVQNVVAALRGQPAATGQKAVKGVVSSIADNRSALQQARREKLAAATRAGEGLTGKEKSIAERAALKGEVPKVDASNLQEHLQKTVHPDDVHAIAKLIDDSKDLQGYDKINAKAALYNLFDNGKVPRPNEWKKINTVLGTDELQTTVSTTSKLYGKAANAVRAIAGTPKAILSSFDLSGMGRQGMFLGTRYPKEFKASFKKQAEFFASPKNYEAAMKARSEHPNTQFYDKMKLALTGVKDFAHGEEAFPASLAESKAAEKILVGKGVEASNRAYTGALSEFRGNVADSIIRDLKDSGTIEKMTDKEWQALGRYINTASGRGTLKYTESAAQVLGDVLFSPRLWKSRLDTLNPKYYYDLKGPARKLALQNAGSLAGVIGTVLGLATLAGGKVETDARSSDFLKVRFGDTRVDLLGGLQQNLVFAWREISGEKKSSTSGAISSLTDGKPFSPTRLSVLGDLVANKEAPLPAEASRLLTGKDRAGNPLTIKGELANSFIPLSMQETASEVKHYGVKGIASSLPGYLGAGQQTYGQQDVKISDKQKEYVNKLPDVGSKQAVTSFFQVQKVAQGTKTNASDAVKRAIQAGDTKKAASIAKKYNQFYYDQFNDWAKKNGKYADDEEVNKQYNKGFISDESYSNWIDKGGK